MPCDRRDERRLAPYDYIGIRALQGLKREAPEVVEVMQKGYMLKDKVIRPAMVKVSE